MRTKSRHRVAWVVACALICPGPLALADSKSAKTEAIDERTQAREHFQKGSKAFDLGYYDEAVKEYETAYRLKDDPALLYNIAQSYRLANRPVEAMRFYRTFLSRVPKAANRAEVELKLEELQKLVDQQSKTHGLPPNETQPLGSHGELGASAAATGGTNGSGSSAGPSAGATSTPKSGQPPGAAPRAAGGDATQISAARPSDATSLQDQPRVVAPPSGPTTENAVSATAASGSTSVSTAGATSTAATVSPPSTHISASDGRGKRIAGYTLLGVGGAALVGGVACLLLAKGASDDLTAANQAGQPFDASKESAGKSYDLVGATLLGVGGAAAVAGVVVAVLGVRAKASSTRASALTFTPLPGTALVGGAARLTF